MKKRKNSYGNGILVKLLRILLIVTLFPFVILWLIKQAVIKSKRNKLNMDKIAVFNMSQIDSLTGEEFESLLKQIFERLGYTVQLTKKSCDFGADLVIEKHNNKSLVQAKCYSKTVGVKAVQEVIGAKNHYGASDLVVATNNYFSKEAQLLASENNVKLMDRDVIFELVKKFDIRIDIEKKTYVATRKEASLQMESKYKFWI